MRNYYYFSLAKAYLLTALCLFMGSLAIARAAEIIPASLFIVNTGITPPNEGNDLKPYGMIYDLTKYQVATGLSVKMHSHTAHFNANDLNLGHYAFVDHALPDAETLWRAVPADQSETFYLFSHGRPGELLINGQWLGVQEIADWLGEQYLCPDIKHLYVYGCNFAQGPKGRQAVANLENALGIAVAASDDVTGPDGDWELEVGTVANTRLLTDYRFNLQAYQLGFEPLYTANFANGIYGSGLTQYTWSKSGTYYALQNSFSGVFPFSSDDGMRLATSSGSSFTIDFAVPVRNLAFSTSDWDGGTQGIHSSWEKMEVRVYTTNGTLLDSRLYVSHNGGNAYSSSATTWNGTKNGPDRAQTDPVGTLAFNFGTNQIDRIEIWFAAAGATLRFQEPRFDACNVAVSLTSQTNVSCNGGTNGAIDISASGGTSYTYSWAKLGGGFSASTQDVTGLSAGTYTVTVTAGPGCTASASYVVTQPTALSLSTAVTNYNCLPDKGAITLTVSGGTPGYTYDWSNDGPENPDNDTKDLSNLLAGTYTVTVTDTKGCTQTTSATVTGPTAVLAVLLNSKTNVSCNGGTNGTIDINVTGGTSPYTYDWSNDGAENPDNDPQDLTSLAIGTYSVTATDTKGCTATASYTITQPAVLTLSFMVTHPTCPPSAPLLNNNGSITTSVSGGIAVSPYTYNWADLTPPPVEPANRTGLGVGTYTLTVTDNNNCSITASATLNNTSEVPVPPPAIGNN